MAMVLTNPERAAHKIFNDGIQTFLAAYSGTKTAGDYGTFTWAKAERLFVQVALRKNRRGHTGFRGDIVLGSNP